MGGKRPDQYQIDPAEAGATDYKDRREDEGINEQERQKLRTSEQAELHIPQAGENPERQRLRAMKDQARRQQEAQRLKEQWTGGEGDESGDAAGGGERRPAG